MFLNEFDPEWPCCFGDERDSVSDAIIGEVPFDCDGTIGEGEDGWEFDKLKFVHGIAVGWEEVSEFRVVSLREVRSFGEGAHQHAGWNHGK